MLNTVKVLSRHEIDSLSMGGFVSNGNIILLRCQNCKILLNMSSSSLIIIQTLLTVDAEVTHIATNL